MRPSQTIEHVPTLPVARPALRPGWVAAAIVAMLALLGSMLIVGALQNREAPLLSECPAGTMPNEPGPADQERPGGEWPGTAIWDVGGNREVVLVAADHIRRFDVCSNTWHESEPTSPEVGDPALVYDPTIERIVAIDRGLVRTYDPVRTRWVEIGAVPSPGGLQDPRLVFDPVTGLVVVLDRRFMWSLDVSTGTWREIDQGVVLPPNLGLDGYALVAYDAHADRLVLYRYLSRPSSPDDWSSTWEFDLRASRWTRTAVGATPQIWFGWYGRDQIAYDDANDRTLMVGDGAVVAYDATSDTWEIAYGTIPEFVEDIGFGRYNRTAFASAYDPLNHRFVVIGGSVRTADPATGEFVRWAPADDVIAFDLRTRRWSELVAPTE